MGVGDRHSRRATVDKSRFAKAATGTIDVAKEQRPASPPIDEHDLDDAFSAWDENDAGARKPAHPSQLAEVTSSTTAKTRIGRKPLAAAAAASNGAPPAGAMAAGTMAAGTMAAGTMAAGAKAAGAMAAGTSTGAAPSGVVPIDVVPTHPPPPPQRAAFPATDPITEPGARLFDPVSMNDISRARTIDDPLTTRLLAEISRTDLTIDRAPRARSGMMFLPTAGIVERERDAAPAELSDLIVTDPESSKTDDNLQLGPDDELRARRHTTRRMMVRPKDEPFRKK